MSQSRKSIPTCHLNEILSKEEIDKLPPYINIKFEEKFQPLDEKEITIFLDQLPQTIGFSITERTPEKIKKCMFTHLEKITRPVTIESYNYNPKWVGKTALEIPEKCNLTIITEKVSLKSHTEPSRLIRVASALIGACTLLLSQDEDEPEWSSIDAVAVATALPHSSKIEMHPNILSSVKINVAKYLHLNKTIILSADKSTLAEVKETINALAPNCGFGFKNRISAELFNALNGLKSGQRYHFTAEEFSPAWVDKFIHHLPKGVLLVPTKELDAITLPSNLSRDNLLHSLDLFISHTDKIQLPQDLSAELIGFIICRYQSITNRAVLNIHKDSKQKNIDLPNTANKSAVTTAISMLECGNSLSLSNQTIMSVTNHEESFRSLKMGCNIIAKDEWQPQAIEMAFLALRLLRVANLYLHASNDIILPYHFLEYEKLVNLATTALQPFRTLSIKPPYTSVAHSDIIFKNLQIAAKNLKDDCILDLSGLPFVDKIISVANTMNKKAIIKLPLFLLSSDFETFFLKANDDVQFQLSARQPIDLYLDSSVTARKIETLSNTLLDQGIKQEVKITIASTFSLEQAKNIIKLLPYKSNITFDSDLNPSVKLTVAQQLRNGCKLELSKDNTPDLTGNIAAALSLDAVLKFDGDIMLPPEIEVDHLKRVVDLISPDQKLGFQPGWKEHLSKLKSKKLKFKTNQCIENPTDLQDELENFFAILPSHVTICWNGMGNRRSYKMIEKLKPGTTLKLSDKSILSKIGPFLPEKCILDVTDVKNSDTVGDIIKKLKEGCIVLLPTFGYRKIYDSIISNSSSQRLELLIIPKDNDFKKTAIEEEFKLFSKYKGTVSFSPKISKGIDFLINELATNKNITLKLPPKYQLILKNEFPLENIKKIVTSLGPESIVIPNCEVKNYQVSFTNLDEIVKVLPSECILDLESAYNANRLSHHIVLGNIINSFEESFYKQLSLTMSLLKKHTIKLPPLCSKQLGICIANKNSKETKVIFNKDPTQIDLPNGISLENAIFAAKNLREGNLLRIQSNLNKEDAEQLIKALPPNTEVEFINCAYEVMAHILPRMKPETTLHWNYDDEHFINLLPNIAANRISLGPKIQGTRIRFNVFSKIPIEKNLILKKYEEHDDVILPLLNANILIDIGDNYNPDLTNTLLPHIKKIHLIYNSPENITDEDDEKSAESFTKSLPEGIERITLSDDMSQSIRSAVIASIQHPCAILIKKTSSIGAGKSILAALENKEVTLYLSENTPLLLPYVISPEKLVNFLKFLAPDETLILPLNMSLEEFNRIIGSLKPTQKWQFNPKITSVMADFFINFSAHPNLNQYKFSQSNSHFNKFIEQCFKRKSNQAFAAIEEKKSNLEITVSDDQSILKHPISKEQWVRSALKVRTGKNGRIFASRNCSLLSAKLVEGVRNLNEKEFTPASGRDAEWIDSITTGKIGIESREINGKWIRCIVAENESLSNIQGSREGIGKFYTPLFFSVDSDQSTQYIEWNIDGEKFSLPKPHFKDCNQFLLKQAKAQKGWVCAVILFNRFKVINSSKSTEKQMKLPPGHVCIAYASTLQGKEEVYYIDPQTIKTNEDDGMSAVKSKLEELYNAKDGFDCYAGCVIVDSALKLEERLKSRPVRIKEEKMEDESFVSSSNLKRKSTHPLPYTNGKKSKTSSTSALSSSSSSSSSLSASPSSFSSSSNSSLRSSPSSSSSSSSSSLRSSPSNLSSSLSLFSTSASSSSANVSDRSNSSTFPLNYPRGGK